MGRAGIDWPPPFNTVLTSKEQPPHRNRNHIFCSIHSSIITVISLISCASPWTLSKKLSQSSSTRARTCCPRGLGRSDEVWKPKTSRTLNHTPSQHVPSSKQAHSKPSFCSKRTSSYRSEACSQTYSTEFSTFTPNLATGLLNTCRTNDISRPCNSCTMRPDRLYHSNINYLKARETCVHVESTLLHCSLSCRDVDTESATSTTTNSKPTSKPIMPLIDQILHPERPEL